jgi:hypothetical protein
VTPIRQALRSLLTGPALLRIAVTVVMVAAIAVGLLLWIGDRTRLHLDWLPSRPCRCSTCCACCR